MDAKLKIVTHLPLRQLWRDDGFSTTRRGGTLTREDIRRLLASGGVRFVVAEVGAALRWIPANECFDFWKHEAKPHLAAEGGVSLDEFSGGYCYFASKWQSESTDQIVVLEKHH
jgi:hypothetical protein